MRSGALQLKPGQAGQHKQEPSAAKAGAPGRSQANKGKAPAKRFVYNFADENPDLKYLPTQLGHFAHEYLRISLDLPDVPEAERDINGVLERCLFRESDGADIFTFGGLAIRSLHHKGTVRVRSRPFPSDKFFGKNPKVFAR